MNDQLKRHDQLLANSLTFAFKQGPWDKYMWKYSREIAKRHFQAPVPYMLTCQYLPCISLLTITLLWSFDAQNVYQTVRVLCTWLLHYFAFQNDPFLLNWRGSGSGDRKPCMFLKEEPFVCKSLDEDSQNKKYLSLTSVLLLHNGDNL